MIGFLYLVNIIILFFVLGILIFTLIYDGDCDKYERYEEVNSNLSKLEIVEKYFPYHTVEDRKYIIENC